MDKTINMTMPVMIEDDRYNDGWMILYAPTEGDMFSVLPCRSEAEADGYIRNYERMGTLAIENHATQRIEVYAPICMLKTRVERTIRREFRVVTPFQTLIL